jgi:hypothetical protein
MSVSPHPSDPQGQHVSEGRTTPHPSQRGYFDPPVGAGPAPPPPSPEADLDGNTLRTEEFGAAPGDDSECGASPPRRLRRRGQRLARAVEQPAPALTAEQHLLLLDAWRRSRLPAGDRNPC